MTTKQEVLKRCEALGVKFQDTGTEVGITAPDGYHFEADAYGFHYADFPTGRNSGWTKPEIWEAMMECMADGLGKCGQDCECME